MYDLRLTIPFQCLAFRGDDKLYVAGLSSLVRVNVRTGAWEKVSGVSVGSSPEIRERILDVPDDAVMAMTFSPDGTRAVLGAASGRAVVYDASTWKPVAQLPGHLRGITSLAFSADGKRLVSCSGRYSASDKLERGERPGEVIVWDTHTWESCLTLTRKGKSEFLGVGFDNNGRTLYALSNNLEPGSARQPVGELIRWTTRAVKTARAPLAVKRPEQALAGASLSSRTTNDRYGFTNTYKAVAVHPSGRLVAGLSFNGNLILWDSHSREVVGEVQHPELGVRDRSRLTFSTDGQRLLHHAHNSLRVFSVPDLKLTQEEKAEPLASFYTAQVGSDSRLSFFSGPFFRPQNLPRSGPGYRLVTGGSEKRLEVSAVALAMLSPDVRHLLLVSQPATAKAEGIRKIHLLSVEDGKTVFRAPFIGHAQACGFSGNGNTCYVVTIPEEDTGKPVTTEARLQRWAVPTGQKQPDFPGMRYPCILSPDLQHGLVQADPANLHALDLTTGRQSPRPVAVELGARGIAFFPVGKHFATWGKKAQVHLWDLRQQQVPPPGKVLFLQQFLRPLTVSRDGRRIATSTPTSALMLLDVESGRKQLVQLRQRAGSLNDISFSPDGKQLAVVFDRSVYRVDATTGTATQVVPDPNNPKARRPRGVYRWVIRTAQPVRDGRLLSFRQLYDRRANADPANEVCAGNTVLARIPRFKGHVVRSVFSPDGKSLALMTLPAGANASAQLMTVCVFSIPSGTRVFESRHPGFVDARVIQGRVIFSVGRIDDAMRFSADGSRLEFSYSLSANGKKLEPRIVALDSRSGKELWAVGGGTTFRVSPDGKLLARSDSEGRIVVEDLASRAVLARYRPEAQSWLLQFVGGERKLVSCGSDEAVRLWDVPVPK